MICLTGKMWIRPTQNRECFHNKNGGFFVRIINHEETSNKGDIMGNQQPTVCLNWDIWHNTTMEPKPAKKNGCTEH
jgi:hypothetical protein